MLSLMLVLFLLVGRMVLVLLHLLLIGISKIVLSCLLKLWVMENIVVLWA